MKQKIVIKVHMKCGKCKKSAMKIAATANGVISVAVQGKDKDEIVVVGNEVDSAGLCTALRKKVKYANLLSVEEVKDPKPEEKKPEEKKSEEKKPEEKKSEEKKPEEKKSEEKKPEEKKDQKKEGQGNPQQEKQKEEQKEAKKSETPTPTHPSPTCYYPPPNYHYPPPPPNYCHPNPQLYMYSIPPDQDNPGCTIM